MIPVKRLNGEEIYINPHLIEMIEATPDTVILLTTGKRFIVNDPVSEVVAKVINYRKIISDRNFTDHDVPSSEVV